MSVSNIQGGLYSGNDFIPVFRLVCTQSKEGHLYSSAKLAASLQVGYLKLCHIQKILAKYIHQTIHHYDD